MIVLIIEGNTDTRDRLEQSLKRDSRYRVVLTVKTNAEGLKLLQERSDIQRVCISSAIHGRSDALAALKASAQPKIGTR